MADSSPPLQPQPGTRDMPAPHSRRTFLQWSTAAWACFAASAAATAWGLFRFMFPRVLYGRDPKFVAGKRADYPERGVYEAFTQARGVWLVRLEEQHEERLVALAAICTHLGCTPNWLAAERRFKCPCHGSGFSSDGVNVEGPAPRPLDRYRIVLDAAGNIVVDKSRTFRRDLGQWNDCESYLAM